MEYLSERIALLKTLLTSFDSASLEYIVKSKSTGELVSLVDLTKTRLYADIAREYVHHDSTPIPFKYYAVASLIARGDYSALKEEYGEPKFISKQVLEGMAENMRLGRSSSAKELDKLSTLKDFLDQAPQPVNSFDIYESEVSYVYNMRSTLITCTRIIADFIATKDVPYIACDKDGLLVKFHPTHVSEEIVDKMEPAKVYLSVRLDAELVPVIIHIAGRKRAFIEIPSKSHASVAAHIANSLPQDYTITYENSKDIKYSFEVPQTPLNVDVLLYIVLSKSLRDFVYINETNTLAVRKKRLSVIFSLFGRTATLALNEKKSEKSKQFKYNGTLKIYEPKTPYLSIKMRGASSECEALFVQYFFNKILGMYYDTQEETLALLSTKKRKPSVLQDIGSRVFTGRQKGETKLAANKRAQPLLWVSGVPTKVQRIAQPLAIPLSEVPSYQAAGRVVMKYPPNIVNVDHYVFANVEPAYYVCEEGASKCYLSFTRNSIGNGHKEMFPLLPSCSNVRKLDIDPVTFDVTIIDSNLMAKPRSRNRRIVLSNKANKSQHPLREGKYALQDQVLQNIFMIAGLERMPVRLGVKRSVYSAIECLLRATLSPLSAEHVVWDIIKRGKFHLAKQECYDMSTEEIEIQLKHKQFFPAEKYYRLLEDIFNCRLFIFEKSPRVRVAIPRNNLYHLHDNITYEGLPTIILYKHVDVSRLNEGDYPQYELMVVQESNKQIRTTFGADVQDMMLTMLHSENNTAQPIVQSRTWTLEPLLSQYVDSNFGKCACVTTQLEDGTDLHVGVTPTYPRDAPITNTLYYNEDVTFAEVREHFAQTYDISKLFTPKPDYFEGVWLTHKVDRSCVIFVTFKLQRVPKHLLNLPKTHKPYYYPTGSLIDDYVFSKNVAELFAFATYVLFSAYPEEYGDDFIEKYFVLDETVVYPRDFYIRENAIDLSDPGRWFAMHYQTMFAKIEGEDNFVIVLNSQTLYDRLSEMVYNMARYWRAQIEIYGKDKLEVIKPDRLNADNTKSSFLETYSRSQIIATSLEDMNEKLNMRNILTQHKDTIGWCLYIFEENILVQNTPTGEFALAANIATQWHKTKSYVREELQAFASEDVIVYEKDCIVDTFPAVYKYSSGRYAALLDHRDIL